jgi:ABC-2 type transport system permease protein
VPATTTMRPPLAPTTPATRSQRPSSSSALFTLARRRLALSARTPRELLVPLLTPVLFALVIAPALASIGSSVPGLDYMSFAAVGTVALLVPINCMFAGIGVIVDRESGARRDLLVAPISRALIVFANLAVALLLTALQVVVLIAAAVARGADLETSATSVVWFVAPVCLLAVAMYALAETLANRIPTLEEYIGLVPAIAIVPFFFAGALFPISALPGFLEVFARVLPLTHALAAMRYGILGHDASGLHDIWGMTDTTLMAVLSLAVVALAALLFTAVAIRVFNRSAVQ